MGEDKSDWWLVDCEQCWKDLYELWYGWELRNILMHNSWTRGKVKGEEAVNGFGVVPGVEFDEGLN